MRTLFILLALCLCFSAFAQTSYLTYELKEGESFTFILKKLNITPIQGPEGKLKEMRALNKEIIKATNARLPVGSKVILPVISLPESDKYTVNDSGEVVEVPVRDVVIIPGNEDASQIDAAALPQNTVTKITITKDSPLAKKLEVLGVTPAGLPFESSSDVFVDFPEKSPVVITPNK